MARAALAALQGVAQAAVVVRDGRLIGHAVAARDGGVTSAGELRAAPARVLPDDLVPSAVQAGAGVPQTAADRALGAALRSRWATVRTALGPSRMATAGHPQSLLLGFSAALHLGAAAALLPRSPLLGAGATGSACGLYLTAVGRLPGAGSGGVHPRRPGPCRNA